MPAAHACPRQIPASFVTEGTLNMMRFFRAAGAAALLFPCVAMANVPPAAPIITEPAFDGRTLNHEDVHMETAVFSDPDAADTHSCTDWEIWTVSPSARVWAALCMTGVDRVHIHIGDGSFEGSHAGRSSLLPSSNFILRVRHRDSSGDVSTQWSPFTQRTFSTGALSSVFPLEVDDVLASPAPALADTTGAPAALPGAPAPGSIFLESATGELLLELRGIDGSANQVINPAPLAAHVAVRVRVAAGTATLLLPETDLAFTDNTGTDRTIYLPALSLAPLATEYFWVSANGSTYHALDTNVQPDFGTLERGAPVPWAVVQPGFKVEVFATGFQLPLGITFVPNPGPLPGDPYFYVAELYGTIKVVRRDGSVGTYVDNLLNFNPTGDFPGSGEQGLGSIAVDPISGDLFVTMLYDSAPPAGEHYPKVVRFHSNDGGQTAATQTIIRNMVGESQGQSHQISNITIGPDGKLYVHMGDGFNTATAQNLDSYRGKILRMNLDGSAPTDNPFYNATTINARDYVFAYGVRNPFGGAWRDLDGFHYEVENGPSVDRFAKVVRGRNYLWDGSDASMANFALYNWNPAHAPVNMAFVQAGTFGGSGFPASRMDHAYIAESGPTWATGPQSNGKRITEFVLDAAGNRLSGPTDLAVYNGSGKASACGIAAGPDGLYFTDLYKDVGFVSPIDAGANVLRLRWVGAADFTTSVTSGPAPLAVQFTDTSTVSAPTAWQWSFGDGATSTAQNPLHTYTEDGLYDVRLSVTGPAGVAVVQRTSLIRVGAIARIAFIGGNASPSPADAAVVGRLLARGFDVQAFDDEPANRPSAAQIAADFDLAVVSSTITSANVAGEFRTAVIPLIFWENALLRLARESLMDNGAAVAAATTISITNNTHPVTQGLALGNLAAFNPGATMSVGMGNRGTGALVLATRSGVPTDAAILVSEQGASLLGYTAPDRRVFLFFEDSSFLSATAPALAIFDRAVCWALRGSPAIVVQPLPDTVAAGQGAAFSLNATGVGPLAYQWRRGGVNLADGGSISGATARVLTIDPAAVGNAGTYDCVVSNTCGSVTSIGVALTVTAGCGSADFDGDGDTGTDLDIEAFFACLGGSCCAACGSADFDGDGDVGTDLDVEAFFRVLGGGNC